MALPLAAIAAAVTTAAIQGMRDRNSTGGGVALRKTGLTSSGQLSAALTTMNPVENVQTGASSAAAITAAITRAIVPSTSAGMTTGSRSLINTITIPGAGGSAGMVMKSGRRYRRTNVGNIKALRRAGRRLTAFVKLAKSMVALEQRARIKKRRRR